MSEKKNHTGEKNHMGASPISVAQKRIGRDPSEVLQWSLTLPTKGLELFVWHKLQPKSLFLNTIWELWGLWWFLVLPSASNWNCCALERYVLKSFSFQNIKLDLEEVRTPTFVKGIFWVSALNVEQSKVFYSFCSSNCYKTYTTLDPRPPEWRQFFNKASGSK